LHRQLRNRSETFNVFQIDAICGKLIEDVEADENLIVVLSVWTAAVAFERQIEFSEFFGAWYLGSLQTLTCGFFENLFTFLLAFMGVYPPCG